DLSPTSFYHLSVALRSAHLQAAHAQGQRTVAPTRLVNLDPGPVLSREATAVTRRRADASRIHALGARSAPSADDPATALAALPARRRPGHGRLKATLAARMASDPVIERFLGARP